MAERDRDAEVDRGQAVRDAGRTAAAQVDHGEGQQSHVGQRYAQQQDRAQGPGAQHVPGEQAADGVEEMSIRTVAAEAGWSSGALRHYFGTRGEPLAFACELVIEQVTARLVGLQPLTVHVLAGHLTPDQMVDQLNAYLDDLTDQR